MGLDKAASMISPPNSTIEGANGGVESSDFSYDRKKLLQIEKKEEKKDHTHADQVNENFNGAAWMLYQMLACAGTCGGGGVVQRSQGLSGKRLSD